MKVQEFIDAIGSGQPALVYLFCPAKSPGSKPPSYEPFLAERAVDLFVKTYVDPGLKDLCYCSYFADETDPKEIVLTAQTMPFLTERRVIVVHNAEKYELASGKTMLSYLESPADTTVLLLIASQVDRRLKFYKTCEKFAQVVECAELGKGEVIQWVRKEAAAMNMTIDSGAVDEIVSRAGTRLSDVHNALTLVSTYIGNATNIREADVVAACADVAEDEIWALTDSIAASDTGKALGALRNILDAGKSPEEIMGIINWLLKSAYTVASQGASRAQLSSFVAKKVSPMVAKLGIGKVRDAFSLCLNTELMLRSTGVDRSLAIELLVVKLAAPRAKARAAG